MRSDLVWSRAQPKKRLEKTYDMCCGCFFFFQAEDGIRDYKVTGVQTCALPISQQRRASPMRPWLFPGRETEAKAALEMLSSAVFVTISGAYFDTKTLESSAMQIGRASCRERV